MLVYYFYAHQYSYQIETLKYIGVPCMSSNTGVVLSFHISLYLEVYNLITDIRNIDNGIIHSKESKIWWISCIFWVGYV